jgi:hypothetical protein
MQNGRNLRSSGKKKKICERRIGTTKGNKNPERKKLGSEETARTPPNHPPKKQPTIEKLRAPT